ncbi:hypothetical protein B0H19DRAFT_1129713 [Mycena capillaripes]|nr:hypothetical protein B0H19DRAFT_1129713 [Mycena capillaripes]
MNVAQLTAPLMIGTMLNWALLATLLVQTYIYFSVFTQDRTWWKLLVIAIVVLETLETLASARDMFHVFATGWGDMDALDDVGWAWLSVPVVGSIIACVCQTFFGWRIYSIGRNPFVFALVIIVSLVQFGAGIWTGVNICIAGKFSLLQSYNLIPTATWLAATSLADLIIVAAMVFYLAKSYRDPDLRSCRINSMISRLIILTAEAGIPCAVVALVDLYLFTTYKGTNYHLALCIELSKIYSNSILLIFNSRTHMGYAASCHGPCGRENYTVNLEISSCVFRTEVSAAAQIELGQYSPRNGDDSLNLVGKK